MPMIVSVDFEGVKTGGAPRVRVPEGDYLFKVTKVEHKKASEEGKNPYFLFTLKVLKGDPKGVNKNIGHVCSLGKSALWNLRGFMEACGIAVPSKAIKYDFEKMVGKIVGGVVMDDDPYTNDSGKVSIKSIITGFFPEKEFVLGAPAPAKDGAELDAEDIEESETETEEEDGAEELFE